MVGGKRNNERIPVPGERTGNGESDSTLLPMLVAGLVLIVVGAIVVMSFV